MSELTKQAGATNLRCCKGFRKHPGTRLSMVLLAAFVAAACVGPAPRDPAVVAMIANDGGRYAQDRQAWRERQLDVLVERFEAVARGETADPTFDVLLLSGGAEWGAFGAGYLAQWNELGEAAAFAMPEFDMIGGISTGALMAAYVASGEPSRYAGLERFYRGVSPDWMEPQVFSALVFGTAAGLVDNSGLREQVERAVDDMLIAELRAANTAHRAIFAGTLNIDYLSRHYWNLAEVAAAPAPRARVVDILVAATAISGVFAPVELDGIYYGDMAVFEGIPLFRSINTDDFEAAWRARNGEAIPPTMRFWLVYNTPLGVEPRAVEPNFLALAIRGYEGFAQSNYGTPVKILKTMERNAETHRTPPIELRWVAIPPNISYDPETPLFDPELANQLADAGRAAAREADGSWQTDAPE